MSPKFFALIIPPLTLFFSLSVNCAPMAYKGSVNSMTELSEFYKKIDANYAFTAKDAVGLKLFNAKGSQNALNGGELTYIHRALRFNTKYSQSNVWLMGSAGYLEKKKSGITTDDTYLSPGIQLDYETKRLYGMFSHEILRATGNNFDKTKLQAGFSFYETGYEETQPWFIFEIMNTNTLSEKVEFIPTLRLINKALYFEAGVSTEGDPKFHLMYTF
ncbi:MAG: hypothetical protein HQ470_04155 [Methylophilales bacterium]|nr:hypothetical protein [Methylophilales bacterium]